METPVIGDWSQDSIGNASMFLSSNIDIHDDT